MLDSERRRIVVQDHPLTLADIVRAFNRAAHNETGSWTLVNTDLSGWFERMDSTVFEAQRSPIEPEHDTAFHYRAFGIGQCWTPNVGVVMEILMMGNEFVTAGLSAWISPVLYVWWKRSLDRVLHDICGNVEEAYPDCHPDWIEDGPGCLTALYDDEQTSAYLRTIRAMAVTNNRTGVIYRIGNAAYWGDLSQFAQTIRDRHES